MTLPEKKMLSNEEKCMNGIKLQYCPAMSGVSLQELQQIERLLKPEIDHLKNAFGMGYQTDYASINLPYDQQMVEMVMQLIQKKNKQLQPTMLIIVGIGGSSLGTIAVHEALNGLFYNQLNQKMSLYFVDTVDADYTSSILSLARQEFNNGGTVLVNIVTKSGTTTETIVNAHLFFHLLEECVPSKAYDHVVITTDHNSLLWQYAQQKNIDTLEIPQQVGGRYSIFSSVGLFPFGFIGIDIHKLLQGAASMVRECFNVEIMLNPAALSAAIIFAQLQKGCTIHDTFIFSRQMRSVGDWYRQLVGESLGKRLNRDGGVVYAGITPTTSIGTNDLHSVAQLYLGGPRDKCTTFVMVGNNHADLSVPVVDGLDDLVPHVQKRTINSIMDAILYGVQNAYLSDGRPFITLSLPKRSAYCLGQFLQMKMVEVIYLGWLMKVNPFDQPEVELYKKETKSILASE